MPRWRCGHFYVERVGTLAAEGYTCAAIVKQIQKEAVGRPDEADAPSPRTIQRLFHDFRKLPPDERLEYGLFHYPESMLTGALPWDASRAALDLLRERDGFGLERPTIRQAKWFYRLRLASPSIPTPIADWLSMYLALSEYFTATPVALSLKLSPEWLLAFQPWQGEADKQAYDAAGARHGYQAAENWLRGEVEGHVDSPETAPALRPDAGE